ncbi:MAG: hypothetical protein RI911_652 [Candidatus Parcubacteria bacterium]|jgi:drug/metabolite transporter (DMT)-like permease
MIEPVFFLAILISFVSFGVQMPLMVQYVRKYDGLVVTTIRNLSLVITMAPLLFLATTEEIASVIPFLPKLLLASFLGTLSFIASLNASKYIPVGITYATRQVAYVSLTMLMGVLLFLEMLSSVQTFLLIALVVCGVVLAYTRSENAHLNQHDAWKGISLALFAGVFHAATFYFFTDVARNINPFVASYFWEIFVGFFALAIFCIQKVCTTYTQTLSIPRRDVLAITAIGLLTLSGTGGYAFAVNHGPFALASGLVTLSTVVAVVVARILFKEKLSPVQMLLIALIVCVLIAIKLVS